MSGNPLKLDFNERADSQPAWLKSFQLDLDDLWRYPDRRELEDRMAADLGLTAGSVLLTNGGDESIELLYKNCKLNDQSMLVPEPCFSQYTHNQQVWQNDTAFTPARADLSIDTAALKAQLKAKQWLILTRPNNPTGEYLAAAELLDLITAAQAQNAYVFLDEAYVEFANDEDPIDYQAFDNLVTLRTFSKAYGLAGARIGYVFGQPQLIKRWRELAMPFNVSRANLQLAAAAWQARDEIKGYCQTIANNRQQVVTLLEANGLNVFPSRGNFVLFETNPAQKTLFARVMRKQNIQIKTELGGLPNAVRITIPEDLSAIEQALQLILAPELLAFDMDGVLIDTSKSYDQCIIQTVATLTNQSPTQADIEATRARGGFNNDWVLAAELVSQQNVSVDFDTVVDTFQRLYLGDANNPGLVQAEVNLLRQPLKQQVFGGELASAVVTGRPRQEALQGVSQLNINPDYVVSADDVNKQKPDPEGLQSVMKQSNSNRTWFCGDTVDDMQAGNAAGCVCIGIATSEAASENLTQAGADVVLENINQLESLL